jgi:hypothetical protein
LSPSTPSSSASSWLPSVRIDDRLQVAALVAEGVDLVEEQHAGRAAPGRSNSSCRLRSELPIHMSSTSTIASEMNAAPISPATARARNVLPQPGGP